MMAQIQYGDFSAWFIAGGQIWLASLPEPLKITSISESGVMFSYDGQYLWVSLEHRDTLEFTQQQLVIRVLAIEPT